MRFYRYPLSEIPDLQGYVMLSFDAPPLNREENAKSGLLLLDATWKRAEKMQKFADDYLQLPKRSLPSLITAYPRRQDDCLKPGSGLASVEALFAAYRILGRDTSGLLDAYHWREGFLSLFDSQIFATLP